MTTLDESLIDMEMEGDQPRDDVPEETPERVAPSRWVRKARFREKMRGYHPADVDAFLDQVAFAFDELEARLTDAEERAAKAAGDTAVLVADDETVRRTLTLAQRTAELAIAEAERQAAALVEAAQAEAAALVERAEAEAAEIKAREQGALEAELARLEEARTAATADLERIEARRRTERERLTAILAELASLVDDRLRSDTEPGS